MFVQSLPHVDTRHVRQRETPQVRELRKYRFLRRVLEFCFLLFMFSLLL